MQPPRPGQIWTRQRVELRLAAAFRLMPGLPVYGRPTRPRPVDPGDQGGADGTAADVTDILAWAELIDDDPDGRKYLWAWARCRATRESFAALCRAMGWPAATAERGRRRAGHAIAAALGRRDRQRSDDVDSGRPAI